MQRRQGIQRIVVVHEFVTNIFVVVVGGKHANQATDAKEATGAKKGSGARIHGLLDGLVCLHLVGARVLGVGYAAGAACSGGVQLGCFSRTNHA